MWRGDQWSLRGEFPRAMFERAESLGVVRRTMITFVSRQAAAPQSRQATAPPSHRAAKPPRCQEAETSPRTAHRHRLSPHARLLASTTYLRHRPQNVEIEGDTVAQRGCGSAVMKRLGGEGACHQVRRRAVAERYELRALVPGRRIRRLPTHVVDGGGAYRRAALQPLGLLAGLLRFPNVGPLPTMVVVVWRR